MVGDHSLDGSMHGDSDLLSSLSRAWEEQNLIEGYLACLGLYFNVLSLIYAAESRPGSRYFRGLNREQPERRWQGGKEVIANPADTKH